jgi:hypothetical protein
MGLGSYLGHRVTEGLLQALMKKMADAQDPETREEWLMLQRRLSKLGEKSSATKSTPRVPGTRWLPPAQVVAPVLAVGLDRPDRRTDDYKREDTREVAPTDHPARAQVVPLDAPKVAPTDHPTVGSGPKPGR